MATNPFDAIKFLNTAPDADIDVTDTVPVVEATDGQAYKITMGQLQSFVLNGGTIDPNFDDVTADTVTINSAGTALTVANGEVSVADKISHVGDANTAIRFPSNDTFTVETGGDERLRVTSAGNVGIGTNAPTVTGNYKVAEIKSGDATAGGMVILANSGETSVGRLYAAGAAVLLDNSGSSVDVHIKSNTTSNILFSTNNLERARIDSSGNFGIRTSSPVGFLQVGSNSLNQPAGFHVFGGLYKNGIAPSGTAVVDIDAFRSINTSFTFAAAEVYIAVALSSSKATQGHFKYEYLTINDTTSGGQSLTEIYNGSAGSFAVATGDFVVTRPTNRTIRITYTNGNASGNNDIAVFVRGYSIAGASIS